MGALHVSCCGSILRWDVKPYVPAHAAWALGCVGSHSHMPRYEKERNGTKCTARVGSLAQGPPRLGRKVARFLAGQPPNARRLTKYRTICPRFVCIMSDSGAGGRQAQTRTCGMPKARTIAKGHRWLHARLFNSQILSRWREPQRHDAKGCRKKDLAMAGLAGRPKRYRADRWRRHRKGLRRATGTMKVCFQRLKQYHC